MTEEDIGQKVQTALNVIGVMALLTMEGMCPEKAFPKEETPTTIDNFPFTFFNLACKYIAQKQELGEDEALRFFKSQSPLIECWLGSTFRGSGIESITVGEFVDKEYHNYVGVLLFPKISPEWVFWSPETGECEGTLIKLERGYYLDGGRRR